MANSLTAASPTYWSKNAGKKFYKSLVAKSFTDYSEEVNLGNGRIADRPYRSDVVAEDYTKGTALSAQDLTYTTDPLTLDQQYSVLMYVDDIDKLQNKYDSVKLWSEEAGQRIAAKFDARILYEAINATSANVIDAADLGGTSGEGITLTTSNISSLFGEISEVLDGQNVPDEDRFLAMSPLFKNKLWQYAAGKESVFGDKTGETGNIGEYNGFSLYKTNNITGEARWTPADNPSDEDTITIEGITFTFQSVIGTTAGNILQTTNLATTLDNLCALINAGGVGDEVNYVSLSTANKRAVQNWVAYDGTTYMIVRVKGTPSLTVTGSESGDTWDAKYCYQNILAGHKKAISAAVQTNPMIDVAMASTVSAGKRGTNVMPLLVGGVKTFNLGTTSIARIKIRTDS